MTLVTVRSGYDPAYYLNRASGEKSAGGYYISPAQKGEAPGRWYGRGAEALGFRDGQQVREAPYLAVYQQIDPRTGEKIGRAPGGYQKFAAILQAKLAAEPHATRERQLELEREAARETRRSPAYTDMTTEHNKSVSVLRASFLEAARRAGLAGDKATEELWRAREQRLSEIEQEANHAGLVHIEEHAGFVRTGYHGRQIEGRETGRWESAGLVITTWLQGTNRDGEPHSHHHNVIARMAQTDADGEWRAVDTMSLRNQIGAMTGIVESRTRSGITREFGVRWEAHEDPALGFEIAGIDKSIRDAYSKRTRAVTEETARLARKWEDKYGRTPNAREMLFIASSANLTSRKGKEDSEVDWDELARQWDATIGGRLAELAELVCDFSGPRGDVVPDQETCQKVIGEALARVQVKHSTWTQSDLIKHLSRSMGPEFDAMTPDARHALLFRLADDATSAGNGVVSLEAPEFPEVPQKFLRELDGRSVFTRPGTERFATRGQLALEERMVQQAQRRGAPFLDREDAGRSLGATCADLEAAHAQRAQDAHAQTCESGLRMDQAAAVYAALTSPRRMSVMVGPAGSGKTYTVAAGARAWEQTGRSVIGITTAQAARDVLAAAGIREAYNSTKFLGDVGRGKVRVRPGTLLVIDEASMMSMADLAAIIALAEERRCKVLLTGDHQQLASVESGGGMRLLADRLGHAQLSQPVRFREEWEQDASLRLRGGDETALDDYLARGRITGYQRAELFNRARQAYVAGRLAGQDVLLMAHTRDDCRELSRQIREDLVHLGLVGQGPEVGLSAHGRASVGDLIVARENQHQHITDRADPGGRPHALTNGDIFKVEEVNDRGIVARRVLEPGTGKMAGRTTQLAGGYLAEHADLAYVVTGHNGQGGTVSRGLALITGSESREWVYVAMTRGRERNTALVQVLPRQADPNPSTRPDPELDRHERVQAERAGLPAPKDDREHEYDRAPVAVLADCLERIESEESATAYQRHELADADHLAVLGGRWDDLVMQANRERYERLVQEELPAEWKGAQLGEARTWLFRSLRHAESAGQDAREVVRAAIGSRPLSGTRDLAKVLYTRVSKVVDPLVPMHQGRWADQVPEVADPQIAEYLRQTGQAMDERTQRLGQFDAVTEPAWAMVGLGPVPEETQERADWVERAGKVHYYRERYGVEPETGIGPEPSPHAPEMRAGWFDAFRALNAADDLDFRQMPEATLRHMRDAYATETGWAPPHVGKQLQAVRLAREEYRLQAIRAEAEARVSDDEQVRARHEKLAASARAAEGWFGEKEDQLVPVQADRDLWDKVSEAPRMISIQADAELRRREPDTKLQPLRSAEPTVPDEELVPFTEPAWVGELESARERFQEEHAMRQQLQVPDEDPDYEAVGQAYPVWQAQRDAILQPPKPEIEPSEKVRQLAKERDAERD